MEFVFHQAKTQRWLPWILLIGWMALIFIFSHQPSLPSLPGGFADTVLKKLAHALAYAILMGLWWRALRTIMPAANKTLYLVFALTLIYAISDEWHQTFIPGRNGQLADVLIDMSGALAVLIYIRYLTKGELTINNEQLTMNNE